MTIASQNTQTIANNSRVPVDHLMSEAMQETVRMTVLREVSLSK